MSGYINNTISRVTYLVDAGALSDTQIVLALLAGVVVGLLVAYGLVSLGSLLLGSRDKHKK